MVETLEHPRIIPTSNTFDGGRFKQNVKLAPYTTWNIGGEAELFVEPNSVSEILDIYHFAKNKNLPLTILGRGSNTLIADEGVPGIVICLRNSFDDITIEPDGQTIRAQAGCPLPKVAIVAGQQGLEGFEFLVSIPGTVGAGVTINAGVGGADGTAVNTILKDVTVLELSTGNVQTLQANDLELRYRHSNLPERNLWVLEATMTSSRLGSPQDIKEAQKALLKKRAAKLPLQRQTSGSVFKQPPGGQAAGWYVDQAGLKGHQLGGARISPKHGNWIENTGTAAAKEVKELMVFIQETVQQRFGIWLEREVRFIPEDTPQESRR
jgi:UDP-N-acetylmuramate dehydrogenase